MVGGHRVGLKLQVGMQQGPAGGRQVVLGDRHINAGGVLFQDAQEVIAAVQKTVRIRIRRGRADFDEMPVVEQADGRMPAVGKQVGEQQ